MIDPAQTILFLVIIVLSVLLVILGIQTFFVLKELRSTLSKANKVLEDAGEITKSISAPVSTVSSLLTGLKAGSLFANLLKKADLIHTEKGDKENE